MKRKVLYSDLEKPVDNSLAIKVAIIMGILGVVVTVVIAVFGG